jgi:hypothetical protein
VAIDRGQGTHPDPTGAFALYLRAAQRGLPAAELNVALMYDSGQGAPPDAALAARWYAAAAAAGMRRAAYNLGQLFEQGDGVPRNPDAARAWFARAAGEGVSAARPHLRERMLKEPAAPPTRSPASATPIVPADEDTIPPYDRPLAFIWQPPAQGGRVSYFVEVIAIANGAANAVFSGGTDVTAIQSDTALPPGRYAWRVFTIYDHPARYTQSGWLRFGVSTPGTK